MGRILYPRSQALPPHPPIRDLIEVFVPIVRLALVCAIDSLDVASRLETRRYVITAFNFEQTPVYIYLPIREISPRYGE